MRGPVPGSADAQDVAGGFRTKLALTPRPYQDDALAADRDPALVTGPGNLQPVQLRRLGIGDVGSNKLGISCAPCLPA